MWQPGGRCVDIVPRDRDRTVRQQAEHVVADHGQHQPSDGKTRESKPAGAGGGLGKESHPADNQEAPAREQTDE
jgi:hypothetical protein